MPRIREPFNALSHFAGATAALVGSIYLLAVGNATTAQTISILIYSASLFGLFFASGLYHGATVSARASGVLRKIDHSAIYLLIAGTYTPFCMMILTGAWRWGILALIWSLAAAGIVLKVFIINTPRWLTAGIYVVMGWLGIIAGGEILGRMTTVSFSWLLAGGIIYTLGAVIYITKRGNLLPGVFGFHELWHLFVLMGAGAHFIAIASLL